MAPTLPILALLLTTATASTIRLDKRLDNGVGKTPAMGWNSWNTFGCSGGTAANALAQANATIKNGLDKSGYVYINIDDCWSTRSRSSAGDLVPDPAKWPNGMKAVTDQIHTMGLKFGLYGDSGTATCAGYPGSQGYEERDAKQLAAWGVDYWKYDNCNTPSGSPSQPRYEKMRDALLASGRTILYSMCSWGYDNVWTWAAPVGNSWRVSGDISPKWSAVVSIANLAPPIAKYSAPGGFNDFDMLEVGVGGLTEAEERAHFGLWSMFKSPLIIGADLTKIPATSLAILKNADVIAINQDSLGKAATTFQPKGQPAPGNGIYPYWAGPLSDGVVLGMVALNGAATMTVNFADVPGLGAGTFAWKELYTGKTGSGTSVSATLVSHDMAIYKVSKPAATSSSAAPTASATTT